MAQKRTPWLLGARAGRLFGLDVTRIGTSLTSLPRFLQESISFAKQVGEGDPFPFRVGNLLPILTDYREPAGQALGHYFFQDLWAAQKVFAARPSRHVDVGSRIDGFVAHVLTFMEVEVIDIRPLESHVPGLTFVQADATNLQGVPTDSVPSLSSLHAVEHFGLGRYGDPLDPRGWLLGMRALARVLAPGGHLYFSVPIGRERLQFNAHRVFSPARVIEAFQHLQLESFAAIDDEGAYHESGVVADFAAARNACGLFEFRKRSQ